MEAEIHAKGWARWPVLVSTRVAPSTAEAVANVARQTGATRSEIIRAAIERGLEQRADA